MVVNWGIIGVGNVTEVKSGPAFYKLPDSRLVAVMRRNQEKVVNYSKRHNVGKWYTDASKLINDPEVNAIYIATPPSTHAQYAIAAMKAGKPAYVEKPMALNHTECLEMIRVSEETGIPLWVAYYRRSLPAFLKVKELVETGSIGKLLAVNIRLFKQARERGLPKEEMSWHVFPEIAGGGHFFDLASHQFDFLDFLFGPLRNVKGNARNIAGLYPAEDTVSAAFTFDNGVVGSGSWCFVVDEHSEEDIVEITGEKGQISFSCFGHHGVNLKTRDKNKHLEFENPAHIAQNLVQQVNNEIRGTGECVSTMYSAARTSWVLDEIVIGYYN